MNDTSMLADLRLQFNIKYPSLEECYLDGYHSAQADLTELSNPYPIQGKEHNSWLEGWWAGFYEEEPLFTLEEKTPLTSPAISQVTAVNDETYTTAKENFFIKLIEISGAIAISALIGYQLIDLVA